MPDCQPGHNFIRKEKVTDRDQRTLKRLRVDTVKEADEQPQELQTEDGETNLHNTSLCVILKFVILMLLGVVRRYNGIIKEQLSELNILKKKVAHLKNENISLRKNNKLKDKTRAKCLADQILINNKDVNFFTGIRTRTLFNNLRDFFAKFVNRRWRGVVHTHSNIRHFARSPKQFGPKRLLSCSDEFLLTLMRIRLGSLGKDLAKRFKISVGLCSQIFNSWLTAMAKVCKGGIVFWPSKEAIKATMPGRYKVVPDN